MVESRPDHRPGLRRFLASHSHSRPRAEYAYFLYLLRGAEAFNKKARHRFSTVGG